MTVENLAYIAEIVSGVVVAVTLLIPVSYTHLTLPTIYSV